MSDYQPPKWRYQYGKTGRGYNLRLLSVDELFLSADLLKLWLKPTSALDNKAWYQAIVYSNDYENLWLYCNRLIKTIRTCEPATVNKYEMDALNDELNRIFSDAGWRAMKQKMSQQSKRKRKVRPEISATIVKELHHFKQELGLSSLDEAVDHLLAFYKDHADQVGGDHD
ncbi:hypothetical protein [Shewanella sp. UCD-KL12]|uniref:hypothetical protein n=1 Tax=Shewanella sp. UCD-KL12 TaxID=1917163 RepID=UPI00097082F6|nr:hypothetical protein [Shewanella sp. UCD-KL12]